jgi:hypothetical protein
MNPKRLIVSIIVLFIGMFGCDMLIHGLWLEADYKATANLWRPEAEMGKFMPWLLLYQFTCAAVLSIIWAKAFAHDSSIGAAVVYGALMGLFFESSAFVTHAVSPLPSDIMAKWVVSGILKMALLGALLPFTYKPLASENAPK